MWGIIKPSRRRLLFILVSMSLGLALSPHDFAVAECGEAFDLNDRTETLSWFLQSHITSPIEVFAVPNSSILHRNSTIPGKLQITENETLVTRDFFSRSGLPVPKNARPLKAFVYSYRPRIGDTSQKPEPGTRGSGRDVILIVEVSPGMWVPVSFKGSGTNDWFSAVNGTFDVSNFRRNGLQPLYEVVTEYILLLQSYNARIPAVETPEIRLLPHLTGLTEKFSSESVPAQTVRIPRQARDSMTESEKLTHQEKLRFAAAIYRTDVGHGAINPENIAQATVLDPGHYGFGFPLLSSIYRCSLCAKHRGSRHDGTMVGPLDYYFPAGNQRHSLGFETSPLVIDGMFAEITRQLVGEPLSIGASNADRIAFLNALQLAYGIARPERNKFEKTGDALLGRKLEWDRLVDVDYVVSLKFFIQLAALKILLPLQAQRIQNASTRIFQTLENRTLANNAHRLTRLLENSLQKGGLNNLQLRGLLGEFLPSYVVEAEVKKSLSGLSLSPGFAEEVKARIAQLVEDLSRLHDVPPEIFLETLEKYFR